MKQLLTRFWRICLFQAGPQDLPASILLLQLTLIVNVLTNIIVMTAMLSLGVALVKAVLEVIITLLLLDLLLRWYRLRARFVQTMTAFMGVGIYFNLVVAVIAWMIDWSDQAQPINGYLSIAWLGTVVWSFSVMVFILRTALNSLVSASILYLLAYSVITWQLTKWVN